jgi:hygromycin-B 7''-O-kinase
MDSTGDRLALVRARRALGGAGLSGGDALTRASSTRNEVYLGRDYVVRVNKQPNQRLRREAILCGELPNYTWTPKVVAYGGRPGADFLIVERRPGINLSVAWPHLNRKLRYRATRFLAAGLRSLHEIETPRAVPPIETAPHLLDSSAVSPVVPMLVAIEDLKRIDGVDKGMLSDLKNQVSELAPALPHLDRRTLIHGDLTFENILWDGEKITAFVDFEWCRGAPADLDLDVLLRFCAYPQAHVPEKLSRITKPEDYREVTTWLAQELPETFDDPLLYDRLRLYAYSYDLRELKLDPRPPNGRGGPLHPYNRIRTMLGSGGYLNRLLSDAGLHV